MGGSAPSPDPNVGIAAKKSAETGEKMLAWMQDQAKITNKWATEDRARYQDTFVPLQDEFIADAKSFASPERKGQAQAAAAADASLGMRQARQAADRSAMAMGVNPASGRSMAASDRMATDSGLAIAGSRNMAGRQVEEQGRAMKAAAINMGSGMAVNPGSSMGISNGAIATGGNAAMAGYGQQGQLLNTQYQQQLDSWQANQNSYGAFGSAIGSVIGLISSKEVKHDKKAFDSLGAVRNMPVEAWTYNPGAGDEGRHIGPYAEDFQKATGIGDGKSIDVISAIGLAIGAVRDLDKKVDNLSKGASKAPAQRSPEKVAA